MRRTRLLLLTTAVLTLACGSPGGGDAGAPDSGPSDSGPADGGRVRSPNPMPSGATCPEGSTLTYETFAEDFFGTYCTRCHSSTLVGSGARSGAPVGFDFDSHAGIAARLPQIDAAAGAGTARINTWMPLSAPMPSDAERDLLGEWIACGAP